MLSRKIRQLSRVTNLKLRWLVGAGLLLLVCIQCAKPSHATVQDDGLVKSIKGQEVGKLSDTQADRLECLAKNDAACLLEQCLRQTRADVQDFTCTFIKQERIDGVLKEPQEIETKFMAHPFSVAMHWTKNAPISDRLLYVDGQNDNNLLLKPRGMLACLGTVKRRPDCPQVMANTLHPVTIFGFANTLDSLIKVYHLAAERGELQAEFLGYRDIAGRTTLAICRQLPARCDYPAARTITYIDPRLMIPIAVEAWDWDGQLSARYIYKDVKVNVGLTADDFTAKANGF